MNAPSFIVIPAQAGTQSSSNKARGSVRALPRASFDSSLGPRLRGDDDESVGAA